MSYLRAFYCSLCGARVSRLGELCGFTCMSDRGRIFQRLTDVWTTLSGRPHPDADPSALTEFEAWLTSADWQSYALTLGLHPRFYAPSGYAPGPWPPARPDAIRLVRLRRLVRERYPGVKLKV